MGKESLKIPSDESEVTVQWLSQALEMPLSEKPEDFKLESSIQQGTGFLSNMIRASVKTSKGEDLHLVIKLLPKYEEMRALVQTAGFDRTEIFFYKDILPALLEIDESLKENFCKFYAGWLDQTQRSVLIFEDLKSKGYYNIPFRDDISNHQMLEAISFLASFHVATMKLEKSVGPLHTVYKDMLQSMNPKLSEFAANLSDTGFPKMVSLLKEYKAAEETVSEFEKLVPYRRKLLELADQVVLQDCCLVHGDLWSNNMMFKDQSPTIMIDWQMLGYRNPVVDAAVAIFSCLPPQQMTESSVKDLTQYYFNRLKEKDTDDSLIKWSFEEFNEMLYSVGLIYIILWLAIDPDAYVSSHSKAVNIVNFLFKDMGAGKYFKNVLK